MRILPYAARWSIPSVRVAKLLDAEQPGHQLQAVNMVRLIVGDSVNADGAQALRELKQLLKHGGGQ